MTVWFSAYFCFSSIMFRSIWNRSSKNYKIPQKKETTTLRCGLIRKKSNFPGFWVFVFGLYPKSKTRKSRKELFTEIFGSIWNSKSRKYSKKNWTLRCGLRRQNVNFQDFRVFNFALYLKSKTWKPRKVMVYFSLLSVWLY